MTVVTEQTDQTAKQTLYRRLLILAWTIEVLAAAVGIFLALSRLMVSQDMTTLHPITAFQGALPFFAVAIIELTKIPLAAVFYETKRWVWKITFFVALLFAMVITFETFFIGFENYQAILLRNLQGLTTSIEKQKQIVESATTIKANSGDFLNRKSKDNTNTNLAIRNINLRFDSIIFGLKEQKEGIYKKYESTGGDIKSEIQSLDEKISSLDNSTKDNLKQNNKDKEQAISAAQQTSSDFKREIESELQRLKAEKNRIRQGYSKRHESVQKTAAADLKECFLGCSEIRASRDREVENLTKNENNELTEIIRKEDELRLKLTLSVSDLITKLSDEFDEKRRIIQDQWSAEKSTLLEEKAKLSKKLAIQRGDILGSDERKIAEIDNDIESANKERANAIKAENKRQGLLANERSNASTSITNADIEIAKAKHELVALCEDLDKRVVDNQIYRLAMQLHGVDGACDLTEDQLSITKAVWFGSLALVVSTLGTVLALGAFSGKSPPSEKDGKNRRNLMFRVRKTLIAIRRRMHKPRTIVKEVEVEKIVEVTKEVPVDKVVLKEVPVEVVRKEVIHVPVFSNDPELLGDSAKDEH
jgi:hypothetical protein